MVSLLPLSRMHRHHERGRDALLRVLAEQQLGPTRFIERGRDREADVNHRSQTKTSTRFEEQCLVLVLRDQRDLRAHFGGLFVTGAAAGRL
jgi:hypothetical protein